MRIALGLETGGGGIGVALIDADDGHDIACRSVQTPDGAVGAALREIGRTLGGVGVAVSDLAFLSVGLGPGSYTGVRVGIATALGLSLGRGIPVIGVPSLEAGALEAPEGAGLVLATQTASRDATALYAQVFRRTEGNRRPEALTDPRRLVRAEVPDFLRDAGLRIPPDEETPESARGLGGPPEGLWPGEASPGPAVWVVGPARMRILSPPVLGGLREPAGSPGPIPARFVAALGRLRWKEGLGGQTMALVPLYLRPPTTATPRA